MRLMSILVVVSLSLATASAVTYEVDPLGTGDFPTIQEALDASAPGDVIELADGTYTGDGNRDLNYHGRAVTVCSASEDPYLCVIDCQGSSATPHRGFLFANSESHEAVLEGVSITNGFAPEYPGGAWGGGILCFSSSPTIRNCIVRDNRAGWGAGLLFWHSQAVVSDCLVADNAATQNGGGIYVTTDAGVGFTRLTIWNNETDGKGGGIVANACETQFVNCTLAENRGFGSGSAAWSVNGAHLMMNNCLLFQNDEGSAVQCDGSGQVSLACCNIFDDSDDQYSGCIEDQLGHDGNIGLRPILCVPWGDEFYIAEFSPCAPYSPPNYECDLIGAWPIGCAYGDTSPFDEVQGSIDLVLLSSNPSRNGAEFKLQLSGNEPERVRLSIHDVSGRLVQTLADGKLHPNGDVFVWDGLSRGGSAVPSGIYFARLEDGSGTSSRTIIIARD